VFSHLGGPLGYVYKILTSMLTLFLLIYAQLSLTLSFSLNMTCALNGHVVGA